MIEKYHIIFEGKINSDEDIEKVKERLIKIFNGKTKLVELMFSRKKTVLKKDITKEAAIKYKSVFEKSGAICKIVLVKLESNLINQAKYKAKELKNKLKDTKINDLKGKVSAVKVQVLHSELTGQAKEKSNKFKDKVKDMSNY